VPLIWWSLLHCLHDQSSVFSIFYSTYSVNFLRGKFSTDYDGNYFHQCFHSALLLVVFVAWNDGHALALPLGLILSILESRQLYYRGPNNRG
jgi:hypothetical protein